MFWRIFRHLLDQHTDNRKWNRCNKAPRANLKWSSWFMVGTEKFCLALSWRWPLTFAFICCFRKWLSDLLLLKPGTGQTHRLHPTCQPTCSTCALKNKQLGVHKGTRSCSGGRQWTCQLVWRTSYNIWNPPPADLMFFQQPFHNLKNHVKNWMTHVSAGFGKTYPRIHL